MMQLPCSNEKCTGCRTCENVCPKNAINMVRDGKGFLYPIIDEESCIKCGICTKVCPYSERYENLCVHYQTIQIYGLKNKDEDIRKKSSSGGTFYLLAKNTIEKNGVVYGCILNSEINPVHARAETIDECVPMMGSKYVQSDLGDIFRSIKKDLVLGRRVLFTGTPCQCQGLRYYLRISGVNADNLVVAEFLCHGASSPKAFDDLKHRIESKYGGRISKFYFRDKEKVKNPPSSRGMRAFLISNNLNDSNIMSASKGLKMLDVYDPGINDQHYELFKRNYLSRSCCFDCDFIGYKKRAGDITFADFWGCEVSYPDFFDRGGISLVLLNTEKGISEFNEIKGGARTIEVASDRCIQKPLVSAPQKPYDFDSFWKAYNDRGYTFTVKKFTLKYILKAKMSLIKVNTKKAIKKIIKM